MSKSSHTFLSSVAAVALAVFVQAPSAQAGTETYLAEIMVFGGNFCPRGYLEANGQLLPIAENSALFSLLGTMYGGDGRTTFALPDLRGRSIVGVGTGPGLSEVRQGQTGGAQTHAMTANEMPEHSHSINAHDGQGGVATQGGPGGNVMGTPGPIPSVVQGDSAFIYSDQPPNVQMNAQTIGTAGGGQPFPVLDPFLGIRICMATQGIYPSRN
ncbi:MAG: tail fiber protein [Pseudomonadota bacterium]